MNLIQEYYDKWVIFLRKSLWSIYAFETNYLINRFHVAVRLFSNRSQMTSKCGKSKKVAHKAQLTVSLMLEYVFMSAKNLFCFQVMNLLIIWNHNIKE